MPTRVRYHHKTPQYGIIVLETTPQVRTLSFTPHQGYGIVRPKKAAVSLPYVVQVIRYHSGVRLGGGFENKLVVNGEVKYVAALHADYKYMYCGLYDNGLCVYMNDRPLETLDSKVGATVLDGDAPICTNHGYDHTSYRSLEELAVTVSGLWWGIEHKGMPPENDHWITHKIPLKATSTFAMTTFDRLSLIDVSLKDI